MEDYEPKEWRYEEFLDVVEKLGSMSHAYRIYIAKFGERTDEPSFEKMRWRYISENIEKFR